MNTEATHEENAPHTTGERLRLAREQLGLSQQVVAERLCLKVSTVRDIEEDNAPADLASTFLRGYIRSYARLVHVPEEELLPMLAKQAPVRTAQVAPMQTYALGKSRKKRDGWLMSFTWLVLFVVVGLTGAWWWQNHKAQQEEISTMADQSSAELSQNAASSPQSVPLNTDTPADASQEQATRRRICLLAMRRLRPRTRRSRRRCLRRIRRASSRWLCRRARRAQIPPRSSRTPRKVSCRSGRPLRRLPRTATRW